MGEDKEYVMGGKPLKMSKRKTLFGCVAQILKSKDLGGRKNLQVWILSRRCNREELSLSAI